MDTPVAAQPDPFKIQPSGGGYFSMPEPSLCIACKGTKMLCSKSRCPILIKHYAKLKNAPQIDSTSIYGSAPGVFVGRHGYPLVSIGPLVPPMLGDTAEMDTPEHWIGKTIDDIVGFRSGLVRGLYKVNVRKPEQCGKIVEDMTLLAMAKDPVDTAAEFFRKPAGRIELDDEVQPFGPSAPLKKAEIGNFKLDHRIEKAYYDDDLMARDAVMDLYKDETMVTRIQRAFSMGAFGAKKSRRIVPTRQSITAVDSILGENLMGRVRDLPLINEYRVFESWQLDNRFIVLMIPEPWSYELVEAWYPDTVWNPAGRDIMIISDAERFEGRTTYASIGGCYYAARLASCEYLVREGRQAKVVILREAHSGYVMPVGVWNVRENVRNALKGPCSKFNTLNETLTFIQTKFDIPISRWTLNSFVLKDSRFQRRLTDF